MPEPTDDWTFETIAERDSLTEGPAWDGDGLLYSHCTADLTLRWNPGTGESSVWREGTGAANGMVFDGNGRLFVCEGKNRRIAEYVEGEPTRVVVDNFEGLPFNEPNDLAVDSRGRIWFTDPNYGGRPLSIPTEQVYRADPQSDGSYSVDRVTEDMRRPNGILVSPSEDRLFVADTPSGAKAHPKLVTYPIAADGSLGEQATVHDFGWGRGIDGMCWDADGNIVATAGSHRYGPGPMIYVFAMDGRVLQTQRTPSDMPTNCLLAGPDNDELFITYETGIVHKVRDSGLKGL
ncbi:MAG: SMP-30/gluconolactonase/LRE family protein [Dehalococcoidia bacterium]|jgi:gluconolactonase|nr:SMP-30/gluconolactonase/LRE family protein [Dehalococcoidia bacterium]